MSTTLFEPIGLPAIGKGGIFWFPTIANLTAPKVSEATKNLTGVPDSGWEPTYDEGAGEHMKYISMASYEVRGKGKWTGGTFTYEFDPQMPTSAAYALSVLTEGLMGYLGHRLGLPKTTEIAAAQVLSFLYPVQWGKPVAIPIDNSTDGQLLQVKQRFFITGPVTQNVTVAA